MLVADLPTYFGMTKWEWIIVGYLLAAFISVIPSLRTVFAGVKLNPGGPSFDQSQFSEPAKQRLANHYERMRGTFGFWKREAARYGRFHYYCFWWTTISSLLIPFLTQAVDPADAASKWFLTVVSAHVALLLGLHRGLKAPELHRALRLGESDFYDTYRRLLDRPTTFRSDEETQINRYFEEIELIRKFVRNAETDNQPAVADLKEKH